MTDLELNTAIAALLGAPKTHEWESTGQCTYDATLYECSKCGEVVLTDFLGGIDYPCIPPYATDLNRAVAAGRTLKLFDYDVSIDVHCVGNGATVHHRYTDRQITSWLDRMEPIGRDQDHPARAVCAAILKFHSLKSEQKIIGDGDHAWIA
jgi:hypothetical protein